MRLSLKDNLIFLLVTLVINKKLKTVLITFPINPHQSIEQH